jgi:hypothetical protein
MSDARSPNPPVERPRRRLAGRFAFVGVGFLVEFEMTDIHVRLHFSFETSAMAISLPLTWQTVGTTNGNKTNLARPINFLLRSYPARTRARCPRVQHGEHDKSPCEG